jgi:hypothetical protein
MNKTIKVIIGIAVGIFMIPAIYALGVALFGTVLAFLANPKVMMIVLCSLAVLSLPGALIIWFIKG